MEKNELYHYGVKGMKWGVRKDRVKSAGHTISKKAKKLAADFNTKRKARRAQEEVLKREQKIMKTPIKKLTTAELQERSRILAARKQTLDLERSCKQASADTVNTGKAFVKKLGTDMLVPAVLGAGKSVLTDYFVKIGKDKLGLKEVDDGLPKVKTWEDMIKKQTYEDNVKRAAKEKADADAKAAKEKADADAKAAAQKQVDDYNAKWAKGESQDSVTSSTYSKKGSDINDATTSTSSKASSGSTKSDDNDGPYSGTVEGEGTSRYTGKTSTPTYDYDADWRPVNSDTSVSDTSTALVATGRSYVNDLLLEDKYR